MYWVALGSSENWKTTIEGKKIWGLALRHKYNWDKVKEGDILLFYATRPVKGLVGFGKIRSKKIDETPLWPQEGRTENVLWPLRLLLEIEFSLSPQQWNIKRVPVPRGIFLARGFQQIKDDPAKIAIEALRAN